MPPKRLVIAGLGSSCGKSTVALALILGFRSMGLDTHPFKVGPDFIDTQFHALAAGEPSINLDGFLSDEAHIKRSLASRDGSGISVIEGAMGLFDGVSGSSDFGSTAWVASITDSPILLVMDVSNTARTAAAVSRGVKNELSERHIKLAGVVLNRTGSEGHFKLCASAFGDAGIQVLGHLPETEEIHIPERHLGLVTPEEHMHQPFLKLLKIFASHFDAEAILHAAICPPLQVSRQESDFRPHSGTRARIGIVVDSAFSFYYHDNIDSLKKAGAEMVPFSILSGKIPECLDGVYIGGGYPELYAAQIFDSRSALLRLKSMAEAGMPLYAECGGFMVMSTSISDLNGVTYPMGNLFQTETAMTRHLRIGYRNVRITMDTVMGKRGLVSRGHEFHYATDNAVDCHRPFLMSDPVSGREAPEGHAVQNALGSFLHLHFASCPSMAENFVDACMRYGRR